ncbi:hypothetical protein NKI04_22990 [Mesorhizobium sp. M0814]|uniref:hypothetical protein n=1 Tax=Mesorhizobium sp. M0814 TaxID=2957004 RepID=UPI0033353438
MTTLYLDWQRPKDGARFDPVPGLPPLAWGGQEDQFVRANSDAIEQKAFRIYDLKTPLAVAFVNCRSGDDFAGFVAEHGFPWFPNQKFGVIGMEALTGLRVDLVEGLEGCNLTAHQKVELGRCSLGAIAIEPTLEFSRVTNAPRLTMRPGNLAHLMRLEIISAYEDGASFRRCEHCDNGFLTGKNTQGRSTARFCADKCRMAALRKRAKGGR